MSWHWNRSTTSHPSASAVRWQKSLQGLFISYVNGYSANFLFLYAPDSLPVCSYLSVPLFFFSVGVSGYLCVCPPLACSLCPLQVFVLSSSLLVGLPFLLPECSLSPSVCISLSIWLSVSPRAGCLYDFFSTRVSSFAGNYAALSNANQREVCEGFGTDNEYQTPANLFLTRLQSPRRANIECLLALCCLSVCRSACLHSMVLPI